MKAASRILAISILALLLAACGGGGGGGSSYEVAGDANLAGTWVFDAGVHPMSQISMYPDGGYVGIFYNGCTVNGKWLTHDSNLKFTVSSLNSSGLCSYYDISAGDSMVVGYFFLSLNEVSIANRDGTSWYIRAP